MFTKLLFLLVCASSCAMADFVNGSFSTGDLTGWTTYLTPNGRNDFGDVVLFDTTGNGASYAARFEVGQVGFNELVPAGGGIRQSLFLRPGAYTLTADIASLGADFSNRAGGLFTALLGATTLDTYNFDFIDVFPATLRTSRTMSFVIGAAGTYEFSFQFVRPFTTNTNTPDNYIDNIHLSGGPSAVPEPAEWTSAALTLAGLAAGLGGRRGRQAV